MGLRGIGAKPIRKRNFFNSVERAQQAIPWNAPGLTRAEKVIAFLETLPVTSGNLAGTKFKVRDWQRRDIIEPMYAVDANGLRFVREAFISMPRKQGKTGLVAGLALCHLCGPEAQDDRAQLASGAADRDQAALIFAEMCAIIERVEWMSLRVIVGNFKKELKDSHTGRTYKALSSESKTKHGLSLVFWIYDELAQAPDRKLYDVLSTATGAWEEPLGIVISTQAEDSLHIMSQLYDDAEQIQHGVIEDKAKHACIYSAPITADPWDEAEWHACNPALGDFRSLEEMRDFARKAKRMPGLEATFRLLYLNQRVKTEKRFFPSGLWESLGEAAAVFNENALLGRECVGALDLSGSGKNDLTSLILDFDVDGTHKTLPFFWAAADGLEEAERRDKAPFRQWAKDGHLLTTPGALLDYGFIAQKLAHLSTLYRIRVIAVDPWNIDRLVAALNEIKADVTLQKHGQSYQDMNASITALEDSALAKKLRHNRNPVLTWCFDNVMVTQDSNGNRKFDKRKSTGRIDGAVALAMAEGLAAAPKTEEKFQLLFM